MTNIASEEAGPARVFLSSTSDDIPDFRQAAIRVIQSVPWTVCAFMEDYSAKPHSARIVDDHEVDSCDFFIGILGFEYGNCPPESTLSFTELEFEAAIDRQKPRFMFLYQPTDPTATKNKASTADPRQEQFRSRVKELHIVDFFATTIDLVAGILKVLRQIDPESSNELVATRELPATWAEIPGPPECYLARAPGLDSAFTGRHQDLDLLQGWIENDKEPIYVLQALGGMGKTCLVRQCISQWSGIGSDNPIPVFWWSFGEDQSGFADFLDEALIYMSNQRILPHEFLSDSDRVRILRLLLRQSRVLLVLDGFEQELRAYERVTRCDEAQPSPEEAAGCIDRSASEFLSGIRGLPRHGAKVLVTTRILPRELIGLDGVGGKGTVVRRLVELSEDETVAWFRQCGVQATRAEIAQVCGPYDFHPLTVRVIIAHVLAGLRHMDAFHAASKVDPVPGLISGGNHVLDTAVHSLSDEAREVLSVLAAFHYGVPLALLESLCERLPKSVEELVQDLIVRGLVNFNRVKRVCDMHAILRSYVYRTVRDKASLHERIREQLLVMIPDKVDPGDRNEWPLLLELFRQTARSGRIVEASDIFQRRLQEPLWRQGAFLLARTLGEILIGSDGAVDSRLSLQTRSQILNNLSAYSAFLGEPEKAVAFIQRVVENSDDINRRSPDFAFMVSNRAYYRIRLGDLASAELDLNGCMTQYSGNRHDSKAGYVFVRLGLLESYRGHFQESRRLLRAAMIAFRASGDADGCCHVWAYRTWRAFHMGRECLAYHCAKKALETARRLDDERLLARGRFHMGAALASVAVNAKSARSLRKAESLLADALARLRGLRLVEFEPSCLRALGEIQICAGRPNEAREYLDEALELAQRCSYRFDEAEIWHTMSLLYANVGDISAESLCLETALEFTRFPDGCDSTYDALARRVRAQLAPRG